jgi:hypothetical protein
MRRRSLILALLVVVVLMVGVGTALALLIHHEPTYYRRAAIPRGHQRYTWSRGFQEEFTQLCNALQRDDIPWSAQFAAEQINGFLQEEFLESGIDEKMLPDKVSDPRVAIDADRFRLGFRYGYGGWSAIITIDMRLWVAQGEPNTVGLELLGLHAGALRINAQSLLEHVSEAARRSGVDVSWYRHDGHPVALLRFGPDQPRTTVHLRHVELQPGRLVIQGGCTSAVGTTPSATAAK